MANNYKIIEGDKKSVFHVKENKTDQIIKTFKNFNEARKFVAHLNKGAFFDGFTPNFFLKSMKV